MIHGDPDPSWSPLWHTPLLGATTDGPQVSDFAETFMVASKGMKAGERLVFADWQRWALSHALQRRADGCFQYRQFILGMPRKTAKSLMGAAIALYYLVGVPDLGREIYSIAGDRKQAKLVFDEARWQVLRSPLLTRETKVFRDAIEHPKTGSVYRVLSHDGKLAQGLNPFLTIADEVHVYPSSKANPRSSDLWSAMAQGGGARSESLLLAITTAGDNFETLCGDLYEKGSRAAAGTLTNPTFGGAWWAAPNGCDHRDEAMWHKANPNLRLGLANLDDMQSALSLTDEMEFRRYRLNQFIHGGGSAWMDMELWDSRAQPDRKIAAREPIVMAFDGSVSDDATALVGMTVNDPHLFVLGVWQKPKNDDDWRVPRGEVANAVDDAFDKYDVRCFQMDIAYWESEFRDWQERYGKRIVLDFTMSNARMVPAVQETYAAVSSGVLSHSGDGRLREHVANAMRKDTPRGVTIGKDARGSARKIDLAVAACMANDARLRAPKPRRARGFGF